MAANDRPPSALRGLVSFSRELVIGLRRMIADPTLIEATRLAVGLPPSTAPPDSAGSEAKFAEIERKLSEFDDRPDEEFALDEQVAEFLLGGKHFAQVLELMMPGKPADDPRTYLDLAYAVATIFASEWLLRPRVPWLYAAIRLLMLGYERVEDLPRFDPFQIFDRLTRRTQTRTPGFGPVEAFGGLAVPVLVVIANVLASKVNDPARIPALKKGTPYLDGKFDFMLGWDASPDAPGDVQDLLARAITIGFTGALKAADQDDQFALDFLVTLLALAAEDGGPGFLIRGGGAGSFTYELPEGKPKAIKRSIEFKAAGGPGLDFLWNTETGDFKSLGSSGGSPSFELAYQTKGTEAIPALRIGKPGKSRLDLVTLKIGGTLSDAGQYLFIEVKGGELVIDVAELVSIGPVGEFFKSIGAGTIGGRIDGKLKLDSHEGLVFEGEAALKVRLASNVSARGADGGITLHYVDLELGASTKGGIMLGVAAAAAVKIFGFTATLDRIGFAAVFEEDAGSIAIRHDFRPPKGIGLKIDIGFVSGGGFLLLDEDRGEFAGAIEISILFGISIKAIAILTTKVPGGQSKFALFLAGYFRMPGGWELGSRFTLNAIGCMLGINHGFDRAALERALPSGAMDDVLFPDDPVGDAPRIINSLRTIFPVLPGATTIGIMAELGWGSDYLCSLRIGVIFPVEKGALRGIALLGRMEVVCFKFLPKSVRTQLICDFVGEVTFYVGNFDSVSFVARLRDSRIGFVSIEGGLVFSLQTRPKTRMIIAAGGFHPNYKQVPPELAPVDRLSSTYNIGLVKVFGRQYFAVAPGSIQFGSQLGIRYALGPLALEGSFGFDALITLLPAFRFEATVYGAVGLRFRGHDLLGISVRLTLWGPSSWRAKGTGEFTFLFWDVSIDFDESWGEEDKIERDRVNVASLVARDLQEKTNWRLERPQGADPLVALAESDAGEEGAVHPFSILTFIQRRVPFALDLQRYGSAAIEGPAHFPIPQVTDAAGRPFGTPAVLTEQFAVAEYLDLSEDDRLSRPGFQAMAAGVATSAQGYATPPGPLVKLVDIQYEEVFRDTGDRSSQVFQGFDRVTLMRVAAGEAAGRSEVRFASKLADSALEPVQTKTPAWVAAHEEHLRPDTAVSVPEWAVRSPALVSALQTARARLLVIEDFEVTG
jgi:hypothetical protein